MFIRTFLATLLAASTLAGVLFGAGQAWPRKPDGENTQIHSLTSNFFPTL